MAFPETANDLSHYPFARLFEGGPFSLDKPFEPRSFEAGAASALMRAPIGACSPLWGLFVGAAATGAAYWWLSQWTRPQNLEAVARTPAPPEPVADPAPEMLAGPEVSPEPDIPAAPAVPTPEPDQVSALVDTAADTAAEPVVAAEGGETIDAVEAATAEPPAAPAEVEARPVSLDTRAPEEIASAAPRAPKTRKAPGPGTL